MALKAGKIYTPSGVDEVRQDFLDDVELGAKLYGIAAPPVQPGSDWYVLGTALGNIAILQYNNISVGDDGGSILTAVGEQLDDIREGLGLPEVEPTRSSGKVKGRIPGTTAGLPSTATIPAGKQLVWPNGKRGQTVETVVAATDGALVRVASIDVGSDMNLAAGKKVKFVDPPVGVEADAEVSAASPITGGLDAETDQRKRDRCLNEVRNKPASGNWSDNVRVALDSHAGLQYAFVYPALGGPASRKVVLTKDVDVAANDFSRVPDAVLVSTVRAALHADLPEGTETVVQAVAQTDTDVALTASLPSSALAGGNGKGWIDFTPWPPLSGGDTKVAITAVTSSTVVTVNASTATAPTVGVTHVAWWSSVSQRFEVRLVVAQSGGAGAWVITLDQPITDHLGADPVVGEYVSPAAVNVVAYGTTWREVMRRLGPGENTSDSNRLPRALRHPLVADSSTATNTWPSSLTLLQLKALIDAHVEIADLAWSYRSTSAPAVPGSVATAPNVLRPRHFGIYKQ